MDETGDYELIDIGELRRLDRFGPWLLDRPAPSEGGFAPRDAAAWEPVAARFEPADDGGGRWLTHLPEVEQPWPAALGGLTFEIRLARSGQVGCFPEQAPSWAWIARQVADGPVSRAVPEPEATSTGSSGERSGPEILDLFAHTGGSTLAAARAGARVVHVDAARSAIAWARRNAELNGLSDAPIRWIADDAVRFTEREARRGRRYAGVILDPPSFGHDPAGRPWRLETDLPRLLDACRAILSDGPAFVLLSAHTTGFGPERLAAALADALGTDRGGTLDADELTIPAASGRQLGLGAVARWSR